VWPSRFCSWPPWQRLGRSPKAGPPTAWMCSHGSVSARAWSTARMWAGTTSLPFSPVNATRPEASSARIMTLAAEPSLRATQTVRIQTPVLLPVIAISAAVEQTAQRPAAELVREAAVAESLLPLSTAPAVCLVDLRCGIAVDRSTDGPAFQRRQATIPEESRCGAFIRGC